MRIFSSIKHTHAINIALIFIELKLILDINLFRWYSEHLLTYKLIFFINSFLFIFYNLKRIPILKKSRLAMLSQKDYFKLLKKLITLNTAIYLILFGSSYFLSMMLFNSRTDYLLGIFGIFTIIFLGIKSFKTR